MLYFLYSALGDSYTTYGDFKDTFSGLVGGGTTSSYRIVLYGWTSVSGSGFYWGADTSGVDCYTFSTTSIFYDSTLTTAAVTVSLGYYLASIYFSDFSLSYWGVVITAPSTVGS